MKGRGHTYRHARVCVQEEPQLNLLPLREGREDVVDSEAEQEEAAHLTPEQIADLFEGISNNRYHRVDELFASGFPANAKNSEGNRALHAACQVRPCAHDALTHSHTCNYKFPRARTWLWGFAVHANSPFSEW